jgi:hypothetical protein
VASFRRAVEANRSHPLRVFRWLAPSQPGRPEEEHSAVKVGLALNSTFAIFVPARGVILTGYAAIATVVVAAKLGAFDFLAEPASADDVA